MSDSLTTPGGATLPVDAPGGYAPLTAVMTPAGASLSISGANDGAGATGVSQPTGGSGVLGWLSGVYSAVAKFVFDGDSSLYVNLRDWTSAAGTSSLPWVTAPASMTITQTTVTLTAATDAQIIAANSSRKFLQWMVVGANPATVVPGAGPAVAGAGMNYDPGSSTINQGGGTTFEGSAIATNAFHAISTGGTTVVVWEGQ